MTPRRFHHQERRDTLLSVVVSEYVKTVTPVSSSFIVSAYFPDLSSATIRNILAELEKEGLLTHPHTSAGRIPTQRGYRYYVDNLMNEIDLLENEKRRIFAEYNQKVAELEDLMEKTSQMLSDITQYTSVISIDDSPHTLICRGTSYVAGYPEFQDFQKIRCLLSVLEKKERILAVINQDLEKKIKVFIGKEILCSDMNSCSLVVSKYQRKKGPSGRLAVLGPTRMDYERVVSTLDYFADLISEIL